MTGRSTKIIEKSEYFAEISEKNLFEVKQGNISKITKNTVIFGDGSEEEIDAIIYATGYKYSIPFIDPKDKIIEFESEGENNGFYFGPLYKRMFSINEPNIFFIGLVEKLPLIHPTYERQVLLVKEFIEGKITLPTKEEMLLDLEREIKMNEEMSQDLSKFYKFNSHGYSYYDYNRELEEITTMEVDTVNYASKLAIE